MSQNGHPGHNVTIYAPTALARGSYVPTAEEIIQVQAAEIKDLERELAARTVTASTIANAAINLLDRLCDLGHGSRDTGVLIEKSTWEKTRGLQLTVEGNEKTGRVTVRAREQEKPAPLAHEDREF